MKERHLSPLQFIAVVPAIVFGLFGCVSPGQIEQDELSKLTIPGKTSYCNNLASREKQVVCDDNLAAVFAIGITGSSLIPNPFLDCSATIIDAEDMIFVTARHCDHFDRATYVKIQRHDDESPRMYPVKKVLKESNQDSDGIELIAIVASKEDFSGVSPIRLSEKPLSLNTPVIAIGYPIRKMLKDQEYVWVIEGITTGEPYVQQDIDTYFLPYVYENSESFSGTDQYTFHGMSGGAVIDARDGSYLGPFSLTNGNHKNMVSAYIKGSLKIREMLGEMKKMLKK